MPDRSPEPPIDAREALGRAQAELVAALVAGGEAPEGFDVERLRIQETALISKRRGVVARLRPDLVVLLGGDLAAEFDGYARGRPKPRGGSRADAADFAAWLAAKGLPPPGREPESPGREPEKPGREPGNAEPVRARRRPWFRRGLR
ncbi:hypothetical protein [Streptosporangium sp. NPDC051022]|uniref:hypothetical protein n=1 Tax=Streptosporangium sp. NPDC051022 TaxID=3155752 RepID=UPI0034185EC6